ncbi:hypothetical protein ACFSTE_02505 [Aquimarina hainanensis]|uniref:Lipoprotein n=1 Tax=Aquimarina hainanensis TaxID=1578017 RepID=A0ABW5N4Z4_9FLAO|nr:hypothetical protein [Aquimarina sp. TRL1]QKX05403.1 hypothetical protein HN014_10910 [Aquimarina sp. TRL1]
MKWYCIFICLICVSCHQYDKDKDVQQILGFIEEDFYKKHAEERLLNNKLMIPPDSLWWEKNNGITRDGGDPIEELTYLDEKDLDYLIKQRAAVENNEPIRYYPYKNKITREALIDLAPYKKAYEEFSREWWRAIKNDRKKEWVVCYSYPVFNKKHTIGFVISYVISQEGFHGENDRRMMIFLKEEGKWKNVW